MKKTFHFLLLILILVSSCGPRDNNQQQVLDARRASLPEFEQSVWIPLDTIALAADERKCLEFVYSYLPLPDMAMYPFDYWLAQVRTALKVREHMGWNVPDREFMHFVLPVRVNNENLDDFRTIWADSLCRRVQGMNMYDAVLEINHWCHEQATYKPSDARTSSPLATIANGFGRCGEESVLGVAALRAAGIPARQVYTPRWAHTDDNHAWVEAWVDGKWYFMGACEPEPKLNIGWFNAPASRAMLMHTRVFGDYHGNEGVIDRSALHTEINVIANYVPTRMNVVTVVNKEGQPIEGATVEFKIYNYAEFYTVATNTSDKNGQASLETGLGDMLVWASKDDKFGFAKVSSNPLIMPTAGLTEDAKEALKPRLDNGEKGSEAIIQQPKQQVQTKEMEPGEAYIVLDHEVGQRFSVDIDIVPPAENPIPSEVTAEERARNNTRFAFEDSLRIASHPIPAGQTTIKNFLASHASNPTELRSAEMLVTSLSEKDRRDVTPEVLDDALDFSANALNDMEQEDVWSKYVECPRVENEQLRPFRQLIDAPFFSFANPMEVRSWVMEHIRLVDDQNPQSLRMAPAAVWQYRVADTLSRDIFYVALCRAVGFEARIDEVTGQTQYRWNDVWTAADETSTDDKSAETESYWLAARYTPQPFLPNPVYYTHFTLSSLNDGRAHLYNFEEGENTEAGTLASWETLLKHPYAVEKGYYLLTSGTRLASGTVLAHMEFASVGMGKHAMGAMLPDKMTIVPLVMRQAEKNVAVIGHFDADPLLPFTGRGYFMLTIMGERDEPTVHARGLLSNIKDELAVWGRPVVELHSGSSVAKVSTGGKTIEMPLTERVVPEKLVHELSEGCSTQFDRLPVVVIADSFGRIVYFTQGYNTSLSNDLHSVISGL